MATNLETEYSRLRSYLNPAIRGPNTDAILSGLAAGMAAPLIDNLQAVNDQLYIATAVEKYLDLKLADYNLSRPPQVGLSDDIFREIGIKVVNKKQIRSLISDLLRIIFGDEVTKATSKSSMVEPYNLTDGDTLIVQFDGQEKITIPFSTLQFTSIAAATAQEVADAITKGLRDQGKEGGAYAKNDGSGAYVVIMSNTIGASSSIRVWGGRAQNALQFDKARPTSADVSTQWTISLGDGGNVRYTWTSGADPSLGKIRKGDYVNIFSPAFYNNLALLGTNVGTFVITGSRGGSVGDAYFEIENPNAVFETVVQGVPDGVLFYNPVKTTLSSKTKYAAVYQTEPRLLELFVPATTKVIRRSRAGAAFIHDVTDPLDDVADLGPNIYDLSQPFTISTIQTTTSAVINPSIEKILPMVDTSEFPDEQGYIVLGYGTQRQEKVPYLARPSNSSLLLSPSYRIKNIHPIGTDVSYVSVNAPVTLPTDATDYGFVLTDVVSGRQYTEDLIKSVAATGINLVITVLYPSSEGLSKWGTEWDNKVFIWGP
jgi:hypothetical protein